MAAIRSPALTSRPLQHRLGLGNPHSELAPSYASPDLLLAPKNDRRRVAPSLGKGIFRVVQARIRKEARARHPVGIDEIGWRAHVAFELGKAPQLGPELPKIFKRVFVEVFVAEGSAANSGAHVGDEARKN